MPLTQENPSYFDDRLKDFQNKREIPIPVTMKSPGTEKFTVVTGRNDEASEDEFDVFLSSCESSNSYEAKSRTSNLYINRPTNSLNRRNPQEAKKMNGITCNDHKSSPRKPSGSLTRKIGQFLWKTKSKNSVASETLSLNSPTFSPDSSLSIYTNSLDSSDSQSHSSSTNSNQISPKTHTSINNNTLAEDQFCSYSYDDCETYAANMYYNMGDVTSFTYRLRPRNNSIPLSANTMRRRAMNDSVEPYYNNTTFSTFPNPRRHSIAYSSASTATTSTNKSPPGEKSSNSTVKLGPDGYLVPNESQNIRNKKNLYVNEPQVEVRVDVHTPTSSNSAEFPISTSNDSTGTLVAGEIYSLHWDQQHDKNKKEKNNLMADTLREAQEQEKKHGKISQDKVLPLYMSRVLLASSDCEPFCSLCSSSVLTSGWKKSKMDVAIISCQECFFSRNAEAHVKGFFERMVSPDNKKMDIVLQSYDLKDMDHQATVAEVHQAKVQIVIVSHHFLDRLKHEATMRKKLSPINRVLRSKRVISVLLGMSSQYIIEGYQVVLARFHEWYSVELRSTSKLDPEFCRKFTEQVVRIYNIELTNTSNFSVFPKKITNDQQKVAVLLKTPLGSKDELRIELSRGRGKEILLENISSNPYTAIIRIPDSLCVDRTALIEITVFLNQRKLGTKLIKYEYSTKGHSDDDAIERMILSVPGFMKLLDDNVSQSLAKNLSDGTDYLADTSLELMNDVLLSRSDEFPGVMHFAAHYGLEQSVWIMLEKGEGLKQINCYNSNKKTPLDIAKEKGHTKIVQTMKDYLEVTNTWEAIQYMKEICEKNVIIMDRKSESENEAGEQEQEKEISGAVLSENYVEVESSLEEASCETLDDKETNIVPESETSKLSEPKEVIMKEEIPVAPKANPRSVKKPKPNYDNLSAEDRAEIIRLTNLAFSTVPTPDVEPPEKPPKTELKKPPPSPMLNYDIPRFTDQAYSIPPTPRPVIQEPASPALPKKAVSIQPPTGYIVMESDSNTTGESSDIVPKLPSTPEEELQSISYPRAFSEPNITLRHPYKDPNRNVQGGRTPVISPAPVPVFDPTEEDLIDLMNDFKNQVYSIRELELLFANWKERSDVQRSIEEKSKDLEMMRKDYNRIQEEAAKSSRKNSAFDKLRRLLPGGKKKTSNAGLNNGGSDCSSLQGSSMTLDQDIVYPLTPTQKFPPSPRVLQRMKHPGGADRTSMESGASGGSAAGPDSGMSDPDSDKDKEKDLGENTTSSNANLSNANLPNSNIADTWTDVLTKRFIASYIGPNPLPLELTDAIKENEHGHEKENDADNRTSESDDVGKIIECVFDDGSYKIAPEPRPIKKPVPQPSIDQFDETPSPKVNYPPPPPKKKFSLVKTMSKSISKEGLSSPPPPPPRTQKTANVFNYIDYKNKTGLDGKPYLPKKPLSAPRALSYENTNGDKSK